MATLAVHLVIHGRVQGVSYRAWTAREAAALSLTGWVRNRREGTVEALICGDEAAVTTLQQKCARGPIAAKVTHIEANDWAGSIPDGFEKLPTI